MGSRRSYKPPGLPSAGGQLKEAGRPAEAEAGTLAQPAQNTGGMAPQELKQEKDDGLDSAALLPPANDVDSTAIDAWTTAISQAVGSDAIYTRVKKAVTARERKEKGAWCPAMLRAVQARDDLSLSFLAVEEGGEESMDGCPFDDLDTGLVQRVYQMVQKAAAGALPAHPGTDRPRGGGGARVTSASLLFDGTNHRLLWPVKQWEEEVGDSTANTGTAHSQWWAARQVDLDFTAEKMKETMKNYREQRMARATERAANMVAIAQDALEWEKELTKAVQKSMEQGQNALQRNQGAGGRVRDEAKRRQRKRNRSQFSSQK